MPRGTKITEQQIDAIKSLSKGGLSRKQIAESTGFSHTAVSKILCDHGSASRRNPMLLPQNRSKVKRLLNEGVSYSDISKEIGISSPSMLRYIQRNHSSIYERRQEERKNKSEPVRPETICLKGEELTAALLEMRRDGLSQYQMAEITGMSQTAISYRLIQAGYRTHRSERKLSDPENRQRFEELLNDGVPYNQIAKAIGIAGPSVIYQVKKHYPEIYEARKKRK